MWTFNFFWDWGLDELVKALAWKIRLDVTSQLFLDLDKDVLTIYFFMDPSHYLQPCGWCTIRKEFIANSYILFHDYFLHKNMHSKISDVAPNIWNRLKKHDVHFNNSSNFCIMICQFNLNLSIHLSLLIFFYEIWACYKSENGIVKYSPGFK